LSAVVDTSPLLALAHLGLLHLLPELLQEVSIPEAVRMEALEGRPDAPDTAAIREGLRAGWLQVLEVANDIALQPLGRTLGRGEAEVIGLAQERGADVVVLDDRAARRVAGAVGLQVIGTVGVLVAARRIGIIPAVVPLLEELREQGFRLSDDVLDAIRRDEEPNS